MYGCTQYHPNNRRSDNWNVSNCNLTLRFSGAVMTQVEFSQPSDDSNSELMDSPEDPLTTKWHVFENTSIQEDTSILDYCTNTTIQARILLSQWELMERVDHNFILISWESFLTMGSVRGIQYSSWTVSCKSDIGLLKQTSCNSWLPYIWNFSVDL